MTITVNQLDRRQNRRILGKKKRRKRRKREREEKAQNRFSVQKRGRAGDTEYVSIEINNVMAFETDQHCAGSGRR